MRMAYYLENISLSSSRCKVYKVQSWGHWFGLCFAIMYYSIWNQHYIEGCLEPASSDVYMRLDKSSLFQREWKKIKIWDNILFIGHKVPHVHPPPPHLGETGKSQ